ASNGILNYTNAYFNLVRPGIIMYGYKSSEDTLDKIDIKPVAKLKSTIVFLKTSAPGCGIGYDHSFVTSKETRIATIPIGYADGFRRTFSNNGEVIIRGKKAPIIGKICMDSFMCDVSDIPNVSVGDEVVIWDNENITLDELAQKCNTINYEILSCISERVPRLFK
ncbi:MAG: alanine racemase, partial [Bacilli bacterium]|nr:alanine racemase [Bacilli bacterium]